MRKDLLHDLECCSDSLCGECSYNEGRLQHNGYVEWCTSRLIKEAHDALEEKTNETKS